MKYADYINLKLQNFSRDKLIDFSINFANEDGYVERKTNISKGRREFLSSSKNNRPQVNKQQTSTNTNNITTNTVTTKKESTAPQKTEQKPVNKSSNIEKVAQVLPNSKFTKALSKETSTEKPNGPVGIFPQKNTQTSTNTQSNTNTETKTVPLKSATTTTIDAEKKKAEETKVNRNSNGNEVRVEKNIHGQDVRFEKRDGKWYREGTNDEVKATGKYRSYFDPVNGVKSAKAPSSRPNKSSSTVAKTSGSPSKSVKKTSGQSTTLNLPEYDVKDDGIKKKYHNRFGQVFELTDTELEAHNDDPKAEKLWSLKDTYKKSDKYKAFRNLEMNRNLHNWTDEEYKKHYDILVKQYGNPIKEYHD